MEDVILRTNAMRQRVRRKKQDAQKQWNILGMLSKLTNWKNNEKTNPDTILLVCPELMQLYN